MGTFLRCLLKGIVFWCCIDCFQSAKISNPNDGLEYQRSQREDVLPAMPEPRADCEDDPNGALIGPSRYKCLTNKSWGCSSSGLFREGCKKTCGACPSDVVETTTEVAETTTPDAETTIQGEDSGTDGDAGNSDADGSADTTTPAVTTTKPDEDIDDSVTTSRCPPEFVRNSELLNSISNRPCPSEFCTAQALYCHGSCGTEYGEKGCGPDDADAFCKLTLCDENAIAISYEITRAEEHDTPGFTCDFRRKRIKNLKKFESIFKGTWFGIKAVHFTTNMTGSHTKGKVVSNVTCQPSAIHCEWDEWVPGTCSAECGDGTIRNTRTKKVVEKYGGTCTGQDNKVEQCKIKECAVDCDWGPWDITDCNKPCGGGMQTKTRKISIEANHEGIECTGDSKITVSCNDQECPVHGGFTNWIEGECQAKEEGNDCGPGKRTDTRTCTNPEPNYGGNVCTGDGEKTEDCDLEDCAAAVTSCTYSNQCPDGEVCNIDSGTAQGICIECDPYTEETCRSVAKSTSGLTFKKASDEGSLKGCYAYAGGNVYYGTGGTADQIKSSISGSKYRPAGYDCNKADCVGIAVYEDDTVDDYYDEYCRRLGASRCTDMLEYCILTDEGAGTDGDSDAEGTGAISRINSESCEKHGMQMVTNKIQCQAAATFLSLDDVTANDRPKAGRPCGCIYASNDWLQWNSPTGGCSVSTTCGSNDGTPIYDCICTAQVSECSDNSDQCLAWKSNLETQFDQFCSGSFKDDTADGSFGGTTLGEACKKSCQLCDK